ncbi:MAG: PilZ domain-containing protein [Micavibrio aeruginosavorus]|nr:PilZ domain-containing protein [Micavibrio aeruginosavorus]
MFSNFLAGLRSVTSNDTDETRRRSPRRGSDRCVAMVYGQTFPVENWSFGGVLLAADERLFGTGQDIDITLKFKLRNTIIDVSHRGHVVRKNNAKVAIEFEPLEKTIRRGFQQVIDDAVASEFATSQAS